MLGANGYDFTECFEAIEHSLNEIKKVFKEIREQMQEAEKRWINRVPIEVLESRLEKIQAEQIQDKAELENVKANMKKLMEVFNTLSPATNQSSAPAQNVTDNNTNPLFLNGS